MKRDPLSFPAWPLHLSLGEKWGGLIEVHHSSIVVEIGIWNGTGRKKAITHCQLSFFSVQRKKIRKTAVEERLSSREHEMSKIAILDREVTFQLFITCQNFNLTNLPIFDISFKLWPWSQYGCISIRCFQEVRKIILYAKLVLRHSWSKCFSKMHLIWVCLLLSYYYAVASRSLLANFDARL